MASHPTRSARAVARQIVALGLVITSPVAGAAQGAPAAGLAHRMTDAEIVQELRTTIDGLVKDDQFSGAVLLAKNGRLLFEHAYGYAERAFDVPNRIDTKFNLGSMGKMFTGVAILQLAEQGRLSLDDTLSRDLPDYPNREIAGQITIRQLLTHTSGLGDFFGPEFMESSMAKYGTLESLVPLFVHKPLQFAPGTRWSYSNAGFIVLGLVIQQVSGESYYEYVRTHVFGPAGMTASGNWTADSVVKNRAVGYTSQDAPPGSPRHSNVFALQRGGSAGGGYSTVEDLWKFAQALQGEKLLDHDYTTMDLAGQVSTPQGEKYGFGMTEAVLNGVRVVGHGGGGPGINSYLDMYPSLGYTVAIMSNYDPGTGAAMLQARLRKELTGQQMPKAITLSPAALHAFVGKYAPAAPPGGRGGGVARSPMAITADDGGLWVALGMGPAHRLLPLSTHEFFDPTSPDVRFSFVRSSHGEVTGLAATGLGPAPVSAARLP